MEIDVRASRKRLTNFLAGYIVALLTLHGRGGGLMRMDVEAYEITHRPDSPLLPYRSWSIGASNKSDCAVGVESRVHVGEESVEPRLKSQLSRFEKRSIIPKGLSG